MRVRDHLHHDLSVEFGDREVLGLAVGDNEDRSF